MMGWYFNPPPNWPTPPPGWAPPPGWLPDPSWGPAPPGHIFWLGGPEAVQPERRDDNFWISSGQDDDPAAGSLGAGLSLTALILACASLLFSWVPIVNNVAFLGALLALLLGIGAAALTYSHDTPSRTMAFVSIVLAILATAGVLISQAFYASLLF